MSAKFFFTIKSVRQEPATMDELKSLAACEGLRRSDLLWTAGMPAWQRAGLIPAIFEGLPPDLEPLEHVMTPPPLPTDAQNGEPSSLAKPLSPGLIIGIVVLVIIVIMVIINQTQKATRDQDFDRIMGAAQNASQPQSGEDPRNITPP
jgi:GYF domain 2